MHSAVDVWEMDASVAGIVAGLLSPLFLTVGFVLWGDNWTGSPFSLNLFKCNFAGFLFLIISFCIRKVDFTSVSVHYLMLSSVLGILFGDNMWLLALQIIGAKQVIIIDSLKPFLAAIMGNLILNEALNPYIIIGIVVSTIGILCVSLEKKGSSEVEEEGGKDDDSGNNKTSGNVKAISKDYLQNAYGYCLAFLNVLLDSYGSVLTKQYGIGMNTFEINLVRFGFAGAMMGSLSLILCGRDCVMKRFGSKNIFQIVGQNEIQLTGMITVNPTFTIEDFEEISASPKAVSEDIIPESNNIQSEKWYKLPGTMTSQQWFLIVLGVLFVTFICPALYSYSIFHMSLGLCQTLSAFSPIYSIPCLYLMKNERITLQAMLGSALSVAGVAILCLS